MNRIAIIFGTRPEAIKLAPVIMAMRSDPRFDCRICVTAQHREMLDQVLDVFGIHPDVDLDLMRPNQTLAGLTARAIEAVDGYLRVDKPDIVLVQGDTTTVFCAAVAAFYQRVPVGHVEAGLRTGNLQAPWPEEANRVLTTRLTTLHFAPTDTARQNLLREGVADNRIHVTGNTVIDALLWMRRKIQENPKLHERIVSSLHLPDEYCGWLLASKSASDFSNNNQAKMILVTGHRRESFGQGFENLCRAIRQLVEEHPETAVIYPVHLNPKVQEPVRKILGDHPRIRLAQPVSYETFVWLMERSYFILSDSGGVQEEAPSLGKPVLVMRETTERPESVAAGTCRLVGTDPDTILREARELLNDPQEYRRRSELKNPYGDGNAAGRICKTCAAFLASSSKS